MENKLNIMEMFFKYDVAVKNILSDCIFREIDNYNVDALINYQNKLHTVLKDVEFYIIKILEMFNYNKEIMLPYLEHYDAEDGRVIYMGMQRVPRGEFEIFMREKESFLQDLKEGKIWSYDIDRHVEIEISFHSDLKEKIRIL